MYAITIYTDTDTDMHTVPSMYDRSTTNFLAQKQAIKTFVTIMK